MTKGKTLRYNHYWFVNEFGGKRANVCSPLSFSILFNDDFFIRNYLEKVEEEVGLSINQENLMLMDYFMVKQSPLYQQYTVFETNGKFSIPKGIIEDVWSDFPERDEDVYVYFLTTIGLAGAHKQILIQTTKLFYLIDSNEWYCKVYTQKEFFEEFDSRKLVNVSVLLDPMKYRFATYRREQFTHLL